MKNVIFTLAAVFGFAFLGSSQEAKNANLDLVKQFVGHFNNHDWKKMAGMYAETADFKDPSSGPGTMTHTREQTVEHYSELHKLFPDIKLEIVELYPSGDNVVMELISTGTGPDGLVLHLPICAILTFKDGKITRDFSYYDK